MVRPLRVRQGFLFKGLFLTVLSFSLGAVSGCSPFQNNYIETMHHLQTQQAQSFSPYEATRAFFLGTEVPVEAIEEEIQPPVVTVEPSPTPAPPPNVNPDTTIVYYTRSGDSVPAISARFAVAPDALRAAHALPAEEFLMPGIQILIPRILEQAGPAEQMYPDSEIVYSPSAIDFDVGEYAAEAGGYLNAYGEYIKQDVWLSGVQIVERIAEGYSINPRLLLLLLEYQNNWVYGTPDPNGLTYPLGHVDSERKGLYQQLIWGAQHLSIGYYGWRDGSLTETVFMNGEKMRFDPSLNAGTITLQFFFSRLHNRGEWEAVLYGEENVELISELMFGDPWGYALEAGDLIPGGLIQPEMALPFLPGRIWNFTGGPHGTWSTYAPMGAIDFAPSGVSGCGWSEDWVTAIAPGTVVRSEEGVVILDLDGDGNEETGWNILYLHVATQGREVSPGAKISVDDLIGHPSCERGFSSGTHVHLARKYNGEYLFADGPVPFVLSGWEVEAGEKVYRGTLKNGEQVIHSSSVGSGESKITR